MKRAPLPIAYTANPSMLLRNSDISAVLTVRQACRVSVWKPMSRYPRVLSLSASDLHACFAQQGVPQCRIRLEQFSTGFMRKGVFQMG